MRRASEWMSGNLAMQGYCLAGGEWRALWLGLRFATGLCLAITAGALIAGSAPAFLALAVIAAVAGFSERHPFDYLWNRGVRRLFAAPSLPPSPRRRRHAFKAATAMMLVEAALLGGGAGVAAAIFGALILGACATVTVTNLCLPSLALSLLERRRRAEPAAT